MTARRVEISIETAERYARIVLPTGQQSFSNELRAAIAAFREGEKMPTEPPAAGYAAMEQSFEEFCLSNLRLRTLTCAGAHHHGWDARQPEIDALRAQLAEREKELDVRTLECLRGRSVLADAEGHNDRLLAKNQEQFAEIERLRYLSKDLDARVVSLRSKLASAKAEVERLTAGRETPCQYQYARGGKACGLRKRDHVELVTHAYVAESPSRHRIETCPDCSQDAGGVVRVCAAHSAEEKIKQ